MQDKIINEMMKYRNIAVVGHVKPDGDCLASILSLKLALSYKGKRVRCFVDSKIPHTFQVIPHISEVEGLAGIRSSRFDLFVYLDTPVRDRIGELDKYVGDATIINIDHHESNTYFGHMNWVDPSYSSVAEMIFELIKRMNIKINRDIASLLYLGIATDTGFFRYSNTTEKVFQKVAELVRYGVKPHEIASIVFERNTIPYIKLLGSVLSSAQFTMGGKIGWIIITQDALKEFGLEEEDLNHMVEYVRSVEDVEIAISFLEAKRNKGIKLSIRTKRYIDANRFAKHFGGGGHPRAAGCMVQGKTMQEVVKETINYAREILKNS